MSTEEIEKLNNEVDKQFEGNYIEKFEKNEEGEYYPGRVISLDQRENVVLFIGENDQCRRSASALIYW